MRSRFCTRFANQKNLLLKVLLAGEVIATVALVITEVAFYFHYRSVYPQINQLANVEALLTIFASFQELWFLIFAAILIFSTLWLGVRHKIFHRLRLILGLVALYLSVGGFPTNWLISLVRDAGIFSGSP